MNKVTSPERDSGAVPDCKGMGKGEIRSTVLLVSAEVVRRELIGNE